MSRTEGHGTNGQPTTRYGEWWSRRPFWGVTIDSTETWWFKRRTHKAERRQAHLAIIEQLEADPKEQA